MEIANVKAQNHAKNLKDEGVIVIVGILGSDPKRGISPRGTKNYRLIAWRLT
jgi:ketol-acid reductoisomerase